MGMLMHFRKMDREMTKAARDAAAQVEEWAKDGYDSVRARPVLWSAASVGIGALAGGLYALWRNNGKIESMSFDTLWYRNGKAKGRTMAARARMKARRAKLKMNEASAKRRRRARLAAHAEA
jgi:hypothetical protein